jgi:hypothetical protein
VKEYLATLDDTAWGAASDVVPKFVSPTDPAAQWTGAHKGPAFFAHSDNYLVDVKSVSSLTWRLQLKSAIEVDRCRYRTIAQPKKYCCGFIRDRL